MAKVIAEEATAEAIARIQKFEAERIMEAEKAAKDAEWVRLLHMFPTVPPEEVVTIVTGMREKGFEVDQVRSLLKAWESAEKQKVLLREQEQEREEKASVPKPEAYGSWA